MRIKAIKTGETLRCHDNWGYGGQAKGEQAKKENQKGQFWGGTKTELPLTKGAPSE